jgi:chromosome segregation ATPase
MIRTLTLTALLAIALLTAAPRAVAAGGSAGPQNSKPADALSEDSKKAVTRAANEIATISEQLKKAVGSAIKKNKSLDMNQAERQEVNREIDALTKAAKTLAARVTGNQPSAGEAKALVTQATQIGAMLEARKLSDKVGPTWTTINSHVATITQAYQLPK